jgi:hypothetical protein
MISSGIARAVGGLAGAALSSQRGKGTSPLKAQFGYVAVLADRVVVLEAKGAFKSRPTDVVLGEAQRAGALARFDSKKLSGVLEISFADGSMWALDVPRVGLGDARQVADALGQAAGANTSTTTSLG